MKVFKKFMVTGPSAIVHQFASQMVALPPAGWTATSRPARNMKGTAYIFVRPGDTLVQASSVFMTASPKEESISIDNIVPNRAGSNTMDQYNAIFDEFVALADPLARSLGLHREATEDVAGPRRWLSAEAADALEGFSNGANKATGSSHPSDWDRWARFIVLTHREKSRLDRSALARLLVEDFGWPEDEADKLGNEYEIGRSVLETYDGANSDDYAR